MNALKSVARTQRVNVMQLPREHRDFDPVSFLMLDQCWTSVYGTDPTLVRCTLLNIILFTH